MPVPPKRRPKSSKKRRAAHFALTKIKLVKCPKCGKPSRSHTACPNCGTYQGRQVISFKTKGKKNKTKK